MTDWRDAMAAEFGAKEAERLIAISEAFGLDFEKEGRLLVSQGLEWLALRGTALARELRDSHGAEAVIAAVFEVAPILGFEPWHREKLRENLLAL